MAHLQEDSDRYSRRFRDGLDKGVDLDEQVSRLWANREKDNRDIVKALEIAGKEISRLKTQVAKLASPGASKPAGPSPSALTALSEKLREQSIRDSRSRF